MFEEELQDFGLSKNESMIYLLLLKKGILNPTKLSEASGLHRSYVYDTLDRLLEKGFVNIVYVNQKKQYQAQDPKILEQTLEFKFKKAKEIIPQLNQLYSDKKQDTRIELHKGKRVYRTLIKDIVSNMKKNDEVLIIGANEKMLEEIEPIYLKQYFTIIKEKNAHEKIIIVKGDKKIKNKNILYKELEKDFFSDTTTAIFQNKVYYFIWGEPFNLIVIENEEVADSYRKQFEKFWRLAD